MRDDPLCAAALLAAPPAHASGGSWSARRCARRCSPLPRPALAHAAPTAGGRGACDWSPPAGQAASAHAGRRLGADRAVRPRGPRRAADGAGPAPAALAPLVGRPRARRPARAARDAHPGLGAGARVETIDALGVLAATRPLRRRARRGAARRPARRLRRTRPQLRHGRRPVRRPRSRARQPPLHLGVRRGPRRRGPRGRRRRIETQRRDRRHRRRRRPSRPRGRTSGAASTPQPAAAT